VDLVGARGAEQLAGERAEDRLRAVGVVGEQRHPPHARQQRIAGGRRGRVAVQRRAPFGRVAERQLRGIRTHASFIHCFNLGHRAVGWAGGGDFSIT
jgi:hypothetical protein